MKWILFTFLLCGLARADENADLAKDVEKLHQDMSGVMQQLQEKTAMLTAGGLNSAQGKVMALATDPVFSKALQDLYTSPNRKTLLIAEAIFLFVMFLLKSWQQSKAANWFKKAIVGAAFGFITWLGILVVLPAIILGEPYRVVGLTLIKVFTQ